uniref:Uncharacterized protein n=1 Tax=Ananas comosus var. bracteatus TaxID=296719 RepID=A0A6V7P9Z5_ANACO|nr:unnamed protein product [Ananas comosus var. bracteatus]
MSAEISTHLIRILTSDLHTQPLFRGIGDFFNRILSQGFESDDQYSRANEQSRNVVVSPVIDAEEPYRINAGSLFFDRELHRSSGEDGGDPPAVFNVLDLVLIETMEWLKKLRESITIVGRCKLYDGVINVSSSEDSSELDSRPKDFGQDIKYAYRYISEMFKKVPGPLLEEKCGASIDLFNKVEKSGLAIDHVPFQIFVTMYSKMGKLLEALELYEEDPERSFQADGASPDFAIGMSRASPYARGAAPVSLDLGITTGAPTVITRALPEKATNKACLQKLIQEEQIGMTEPFTIWGHFF